MSNAAGSPEHDPLSAYRASEPRRARDPFANPALRSEIARIAEARAQRAASGWRSVLFGWVSAAPARAPRGAALTQPKMTERQPLAARWARASAIRAISLRRAGLAKGSRARRGSLAR